MRWNAPYIGKSDQYLQVRLWKHKCPLQPMRKHLRNCDSLKDVTVKDVKILAASTSREQYLLALKVHLIKGGVPKNKHLGQVQKTWTFYYVLLCVNCVINTVNGHIINVGTESSVNALVKLPLVKKSEMKLTSYSTTLLSLSWKCPNQRTLCKVDE